MQKNSHLGTGMKFPPQVNKATGRFVTSSEEESIKESIYLILMTQKTERFVRPDFGSDLISYTFMDVNITNVNMMIRALTEQIMSQEPRVDDIQITTDAQVREGCLMVDINYRVISKNVRDNLVFPFYLTATTEEDAYEAENESNEWE